VCDVGVDWHAEVAEFPAVFVSVNSVHADGVGGLVHEGTVTSSHHVSAQTGVDGGAVHLIRSITTVVVSIAPPGGVDATSVGAFPLSGGVTGAGKLIRGIGTVIITVAFPSGVDAFGTISAFELGISAGTGAVPLIPVVSAVVVSVTHPGGLDTDVVVTLDLTHGTLDFVAVNLISQITTVIITITLELLGDTFAVVALQLMATGTVLGAVELVRSISAVLLSVTSPVVLDTLARGALELVGGTGSSLSLEVTGLGVHVLVEFLAGFSLGQGSGDEQNETDLEHHIEVE